MEELYRMSSPKRWFLSVLCMAVCVMLLTSCESKPTEVDLEASLTKAAEDYWTKRLIDFDYKFTYKMELDKGSIPFSKYLERVKNAGQIKVLSLKAEEVKVENDEGFVKITARSRIAQTPKVVELSLKDLWVYKSNQWKHKPSKKHVKK